MKHACLFLLLGLLVISGCRQECQDPTNPECENYDPCYGLEPTSAAFHIYENLGRAAPRHWEDFDTDSIRSWARGASFYALQEADEYMWIIGADTVYERSFGRSDFPEDENIRVTLIVKNDTPNQACFPVDNGRDTVERVFYTGEFERRSRWNGRFEGRYDFLPDELHQFSVYADSFFVYGLPYNECKHRLEIIASTHSTLLFIVRDVLGQTGRCEAGYQALLHVASNGDFELVVKGSNSKPELEGKVMTGVKTGK